MGYHFGACRGMESIRSSWGRKKIQGEEWLFEGKKKKEVSIMH